LSKEAQPACARAATASTPFSSQRGKTRRVGHAHNDLLPLTDNGLRKTLATAAGTVPTIFALPLFFEGEGLFLPHDKRRRVRTFFLKDPLVDLP
jgi:hypothetical protein